MGDQFSVLFDLSAVGLAMLGCSAQPRNAVRVQARELWAGSPGFPGEGRGRSRWAAGDVLSPVFEVGKTKCCFNRIFPFKRRSLTVVARK